MTLQQRIASLRFIPWLAEGLAFLGSLLYLVQSWIYAHTQASVLDEGAYLVKGYLFATGQYAPFQEYGPSTNHMPLSFLIPGYIQAWFGPGLRVGRYFSIVLGILMLLGLWILVRRLSGRWWAVIVVWSVALNPALLKIYSKSTSQVLIAFMLTWGFSIDFRKNAAVMAANSWSCLGSGNDCNTCKYDPGITSFNSLYILGKR